MLRILCLLLLVAAVLAGCSPSLNSEQAVYQYVADPANGMVKTRSVNGLKITVKYLPSTLQAISELRGAESYSVEAFDSVAASYQHGLTFLLTLGPDAEAGASGDLVKTGVADGAAYRQRMEQFHFNMAEYIALETPSGQYQPAIARMEPVYGMTEHRNFLLHFAPAGPDDDLLTATQLDVSLTDDFFETGISHFVFDTQHFRMPDIQIKKQLERS